MRQPRLVPGVDGRMGEHMDIMFQVEEQTELGMGFVGIAEETPVGHVRIYRRGEQAAELAALWLVDKEGGKPGIREFAEAFFGYMKGLGYTELWMQSEDMDEGDDFGFRLEEWDNSGWYPKYSFLRKL